MLPLLSFSFLPPVLFLHIYKCLLHPTQVGAVDIDRGLNVKLSELPNIWPLHVGEEADDSVQRDEDAVQHGDVRQLTLHPGGGRQRGQR